MYFLGQLIKSSMDRFQVLLERLLELPVNCVPEFRDVAADWIDAIDQGSRLLAGSVPERFLELSLQML